MNEFSQTNDNVIMNFSLKYCQTEAELLQSMGFQKVLKNYIRSLEKNERVLYMHFKDICGNEILDTFLRLFKLLIVLTLDEIKDNNEVYRKIFDNRTELLEFIEGLYNYWRDMERYAVIQAKEKTYGIQKVNFIEGTNNFNNLVLKTYRKISTNITSESPNVYRQLAAGVNAGLIVNDIEWELPAGYECLENIPFIESIILRPPFICYPKRNKRTGTYPEVLYNPLADIVTNPAHWFCYPAKVGESLAYVYFHRDYMCHGIALCNLFELAKGDEYRGKKPDLIYVFGARTDGDTESKFYHDLDNDIYVGIAYHTDEIDYFGYMKKMLLTLHNVKMIDHGGLPTHGSMVNIIMKDGKEANILIIGDSGAGKSESIEAFRTLSKKYLKEIKIIFDDMGTLKIKDNQVIGYGTEVGAFVRLDDLEVGYAYNEMDRAIFMNPDKINSRVVIPASTYHDIMAGHKVDIMLYANNFEEPEGEGMKLFDDYHDAMDVFRRGERKAKGTTSEKGIVSSYFANPFGPVQRQEQTEVLLEKYFSKLSENNIPIGMIYTQLAIEGKEQVGPKLAAERLFEWITNNK